MFDKYKDYSCETQISFTLEFIIVFIIGLKATILLIVEILIVDFLSD